MEPVTPSIIFFILSIMFPEMNRITQDMQLSEKKNELVSPKPTQPCRSEFIRSSRRVVVNGKEIENSRKEWGSPTKCITAENEKTEFFPSFPELDRF